MRTLPIFTATLISGCLLSTLFADDPEKKDPPEHFIAVREAEVVLKSATATSITLKFDPIPTPGTYNRNGTVTPGKPKTQPDQTLEFTSDCKIRMLHLPTLRDDKGNKIFRTPEELMKLKGNSGLPGYEADAGDLKPNQTLKISIVKPKKSIAGEAEKLYVKRIIIEKDLPAPVKNPDKK
jgi:hypothetical protein